MTHRLPHPAAGSDALKGRLCKVRIVARRISDDVARQLATRTDFVWHQRWPLTDSVDTPGTNDIEWLMNRAGVPARLDVLSVLDIGTTNGGAAFLAERRGASRIVA